MSVVNPLNSTKTNLTIRSGFTRFNSIEFGNHCRCSGLNPRNVTRPLSDDQAIMGSY